MKNNKYKNYHYFEGRFTYLCYDYQSRKKSFGQVAFKEGSFREEYYVNKKSAQLEPKFEIYHHETQTEYDIDLKERTSIYHTPWNQTNTEVVRCDKIGEEQILGFHCEIIEVVYKHWLEGDAESSEQKFTYWCCPDIQLRPEWHHLSLSFLNHPGIYQPYCLALKYRFVNNWNAQVQEYTIQTLEFEDIHPNTFSLNKYAHFENLSQEEYWQIAQAERQHQEEKEREKFRQKLNNLVNRPLTQEEEHDPYSAYATIRLRVALQKYLQRELTKEEFDNPNNASVQLMKSLPSEEIAKLGQLIIKYTS